MGEIKNYIRQLAWYKENEQKINMEDELHLIMSAWYNYIHSKCAVIYSTNEISRIKKKLLKEVRDEMTKRKSSIIPSFDSQLNMIQLSEIRLIDDCNEKINYIEKLNKDEIVELILRSVGLDSADLEAQLKRKDALEKEKFVDLSYNGIPCVNDDGVNPTVAYKIYDEIVDNDLLKIMDRVKRTLYFNSSFNRLSKVRSNAKDVIYSQVYDIYVSKIAKIENEILISLKKIAPKLENKYRDNFNKDALLMDLNQLSFMKKALYKTEYLTLVSEINALKNIENSSMMYKVDTVDKDCLEVYNIVCVKKDIDDMREEVLGMSGVIINISKEVVDAKVNEFIKQINIEASKINGEIVEMATNEEMDRIENFANKIGIKIKEALDLLMDKNRLYSCLYNYVMGSKVVKKVEVGDVNFSKEILVTFNKIDDVDNATNNRFNENVKKIGVKLSQNNLPSKVYHKKRNFS